MSNSFLGHPDRVIFGRVWPSHIDLNQQCPIPDIDFAAAPIVRFAARSLFAMPKGLYCHTRADTLQTARQTSDGEFRACVQFIRFILFVIIARKFRPDLCRGRRTPVTGLSQKMIKNKCGRMIVHSVPYFSPLSIINLRFFHSQVE